MKLTILKFTLLITLITSCLSSEAKVLEKYPKKNISTKTQTSDYKKSFLWYDVNKKAIRFEQAISNKQHLLLVVWASWCTPCRKEIPKLKAFYKKHSSKVSLVGLSIDENEMAWKKALNKEQMPWLNLSEHPYYNKKIQSVYQLNEVPSFFLFDKKGNLIMRKLDDFSEIEKYISRLK